MNKKRLILVGATGSIGRQTLEAVASFPGRFEVVALAAGRNARALLDAARAWPEARLCLADPHTEPDAAEAASDAIVYRGEAGLDTLIRDTEADLVVNGAAGAAGLVPSLAALESGKDLALANKESVVMAFGLLKTAAEKHGRAIIPIDSEHAALFQLVRRIGVDEIEELCITASGGAFRDRPLADLASVRPDEAAAHPNWQMGRKISIDSATMANKGLEVIEAARLFGFTPDRVKVLIHPQSLVHALVRARDASLYANISEADMRIPILNALSWPESLASPFGRLELAGRSLEFRAVDPARYPLLGLAYEALAHGEGATVAYNAADEVAVAAFERGELGFLGIARVVEATLRAPWPRHLATLTEVRAADHEARRRAASAVKEL